MIHYLEAPEGFRVNMIRPWIFMAGGITNCPAWQQDLRRYLYATLGPVADDPAAICSYTLFNPRRENFPIHDPCASEEQIAWEYMGLKLADIIVFWFARGSLNPIVLFELGKHCMHPNIVVGCDPEYVRTQDVVIQLRLMKPKTKVIMGFKPFCAAVIDAIRLWRNQGE
jgi:hypothetical protein